MTRSPILRLHVDELIVDSFAGGGGASLGIEMALGRSPDIAINHDAEALRMHQVNHPDSLHYCEDVWAVDPVKAVGGRRVGLMWLSPDCKHFSKAKGGRPVEKKIRGLAWVAVKWAKTVRPRVIVLENVEEFQDWGPLLEDGRPCPLRKGITFRRFRRALEKCGYKVDFDELVAADFGTPTTRKRLFLIARCDGQPIVWPEATHGKGRASAYRTAAECIEWSLPCPSIFERIRPLAENTLRRIARGIRNYVIEAAQPFIVPITHTGAHRGEHALVTPFVSPYYGIKGKETRVPGLDKPLGTVVGGGQKHALVSVTACDHNALVASHLTKFKGTSQHGQAVDVPLHTIQAGGFHYAEVRAFLIGYYAGPRSGGQGGKIDQPIATITTRDRLGLVTVTGEEYAIADIGMRMLQPRELFRAQGFPDSYRIETDVDGKPFTKSAQVRMCGNSVCPPVAAAILRAAFAVQESETVA
jgi:DNA (cytosine-5)-methyltransferase 1